MTEQQHPITPPPELVEQWCNKWTSANGDFGLYLATQAACWGADQELEACIDVILSYPGFESPELFVEVLRAARRPKPSLKERALAVIENSEICDHLSPEHAAILRRALEQLDD